VGAAPAACLSMVGDTRRLHTAACTPPTSRSRDARIAHRCRIAEDVSVALVRHLIWPPIAAHDRSAARTFVLQVWYRYAVAYKQTSAPSSPRSCAPQAGLYAPAQKRACCIVSTRILTPGQWHIPVSSGVHGSMRCLVAVAVDQRYLVMEPMSDDGTHDASRMWMPDASSSALEYASLFVLCALAYRTT
jgi:hypothetical protein